MKKCCPINIKIFIIIFLLLGIYSFNSPIKSNAINTTGPIYDLAITEVKDGLGLKIELTNEGDYEATDIEITTEITGGLFLLPKNKDFQISNLGAGKTKNLRFNLFGVGFGRMTDYPTIKIYLNQDSSKILYGVVVAKVFGFFVNVVETILNDENSYPGYTLFGPEYSTISYLIKNDGEVVNYWESSHIQGLATYLTENGDFYRVSTPFVINPFFTAGGFAGRIERFNWEGDLTWEFEYSNTQHCSHHDIEVMPNGNVLLIAWEYISFEEAVAAGRDPTKISQSKGFWPDHIVEIEPIGNSGGNIVWEWHVWDHLIQDFDPTKDNYGNVAEHPELIDLNYGLTLNDFNHINSLDYNEELDQLLLSSNHFCEIWVIDHSTTTEEAAGHTGGRYGRGGDLLYRWGNPRAYRAGTKDDQIFYNQHDAQWINSGSPGEGNMLVFNNGNQRPEGQYSSIHEIVPPMDGNGYYYLEPGLAYGPDNSTWTYIAENPTSFHSGHLSSVQRLPNGNTLICEGADGYFFEVTLEKEIVWQYEQSYTNPLRDDVFMVRRYPLDYIPQN